MATITVPVDFEFCFLRKEFVVRFPESQTAAAYQRKNPEGRIFADECKEAVYLPLPKDMVSMRASRQPEFSFIVNFDTEKAAYLWSQKINGLGYVDDDDEFEVRILREIPEVSTIVDNVRWSRLICLYQRNFSSHPHTASYFYRAGNTSRGPVDIPPSPPRGKMAARERGGRWGL